LLIDDELAELQDRMIKGEADSQKYLCRKRISFEKFNDESFLLSFVSMKALSEDEKDKVDAEESFQQGIIEAGNKGSTT
jgi:hypothetical protein